MRSRRTRMVNAGVLKGTQMRASSVSGGRVTSSGAVEARVDATQVRQVVDAIKLTAAQRAAIAATADGTAVLARFDSALTQLNVLADLGAGADSHRGLGDVSRAVAGDSVSIIGLGTAVEQMERIVAVLAPRNPPKPERGSEEQKFRSWLDRKVGLEAKHATASYTSAYDGSIGPLLSKSKGLTAAEKLQVQAAALRARETCGAFRLSDVARPRQAKGTNASDVKLTQSSGVREWLDAIESQAQWLASKHGEYETEVKAARATRTVVRATERTARPDTRFQETDGFDGRGFRGRDGR